MAHPRDTFVTELIDISSDERIRERDLRDRFANFWASAGSDLRVAYDSFVAGCPAGAGVAFDPVDAGGVRGWWVRPERSPPGRAILYLHGGGYVLGSARAYRGFVSQLVSRIHVPALVIDYPLAPEATLPTAPAAALAAWRWLAGQGFDQIAIVGDSAGGGLCLATLAAAKGTAVAGVVFSPWTDLAFTGPSMIDPAVEDPLIGHDYLRDCAAKYLGDADATDPRASPLFGDLAHLPPLLIQVGTDERLLDDSRQFAARASQAGAPVRLEIWEGMHHVFQFDVTHLDSSRAALDRAARFLHQAFNPREE